MAKRKLGGPIPRNTIRISVQSGEWLHVADYPADKMPAALADFEDFAGPTIRDARARGAWKGDEGASSIARYAVQEKEYYVLAIAALWMFMNRPDPAEHERATRRMAELIKRDGGAWLMASTDSAGVNWTFQLNPVSLSRIKGASEKSLFPEPGDTFH